MSCHLPRARQPRLAVFAFALLLAPLARGEAQLFFGRDAGTGVALPSPVFSPNSVTARSQFLAAATGGTLATDSFESYGTGLITALAGATVTYTDQASGLAGIRSGDDAIFGWNTTTGGRQVLRMAPNDVGTTTSLTLTFATPINVFGGYFTGVENGCGQTRVQWAGGDFLLPNTSVNNDCELDRPAGIQFFGFISATPLSSVTFRQQGARSPSFRDLFAFDDMVYGTATVVPEPGSVALLASGLVALAAVVRRRRIAR
ncbi:MAG: PEP-CTERM sorting domain-containing protein [Gemmatimonadaceae bacterium]|jgi:hypothetical protein|nr:PEP-CTERM sorting domain-containing protein [Gemmatimonadaceae bacterium]